MAFLVEVSLGRSFEATEAHSTLVSSLYLRLLDWDVSSQALPQLHACLPAAMRLP